MDKNNEYCLMDNNGMTLEKSTSFDLQLSGRLLDIAQKTRAILGSDSAVNSIDIIFENSIVLIKDNQTAGVNMTMIVDNK
jgi:hypothetical protein